LGARKQTLSRANPNGALNAAGDAMNQQYTSALGAFSKTRILGIAGGGLALVAVLVFTRFMSASLDENWVTFTNGLDTVGELMVDGKTQGQLQPGAELRLEMESGSHTVTLTNAGKTLDEGKLDVKDKSYHAVYNVGGKPGLALVTVHYGDSSRENTVNPIPDGQRVIEVPMTFKKINDVFPETLTTNTNVNSTSLTNVCRVDVEKQTVGCPGWE
jgi:hypothetical protein